MDYLSDDLRLDIASRLPLKTLGCLMCVSKTWQNLITTSHLHMKFDGILIREEIYGPSLWNPVTFFRSDLRLRLPGKFDTAIWLDYCNGLLLLWQRGPSKCYAVVNPLTKQYALIDKPTSRSRDKDYAVLAYDPNESKYFKIVRFETSRHLKVFHSETGRWAKINPQKRGTKKREVCMVLETWRLPGVGNITWRPPGVGNVETASCLAFECHTTVHNCVLNAPVPKLNS
ncbi:hypothetical protein ACFE04_028923 [Oxalis oulophora]